MSAKAVASRRGHRVTALMAQTLRMIASSPHRLAQLSAQDLNRYRALNDKGLAAVRGGYAKPTRSGTRLLQRLSFKSSPASPSTSPSDHK